MTQPTVVGFIFARGGSKGVPKKNIRKLVDKPLIAYAIDVAKQSRFIQRIVVSTDSPEIAEVARALGAEVPFLRPPELATDTASEWMAWRHAIEEVERASEQAIDLFVSIPTTAPLRMAHDVDACVETLVASDADIVITVTESHRSPYFNMVVLDPDGVASLVIPPVNGVARRQDAPPTFDMTTVAYAARRNFIMASSSIFQGKVRAVRVPIERALDIDTELDFRIAELFLCQQQPSSVRAPSLKAG